MKFFKRICVLLCLSALYGGCFNTGSTNKDEANPEQVALADSILWYFQQEQFDKIEQHFGDDLKRQLNKEQLAVAWAQLNTQFGKYTKSEFYSAGKISAVGDKVVYQSYFRSQKLYYEVVFGIENKVIGLFFKTKP